MNHRSKTLQTQIQDCSEIWNGKFILKPHIIFQIIEI